MLCMRFCKSDLRKKTRCLLRQGYLSHTSCKYIFEFDKENGNWINIFAFNIMKDGGYRFS